MRILVVDDETIILQSLMRGIEQRGHSVVGTSSAQEAFGVYKSAWFANETFDWVLTDFQLPGWVENENWLCEEIKDINHDQKILVQTGDPAYARKKLSRSEHPLVRDIRIIGKPYTFKELSTMIEGLTPPEVAPRMWKG